MTQGIHIAAADWVARLSGEANEDDWLEFAAWLEAAPGARDAYDHALALWLDLDRQADALGAAIAEHMDEPADEPAATVAATPPARRRGLAGLWWGAGLTAAAMAAAFVAFNPGGASQPQSYATAKGERRDIVLADGTRVALNTGTRITVLMRPHAREITLAQGEAAFQVVHDAGRPFAVRAGDRIMRDVGTDFDVTRNAGLVTVTVREGMVAVQRAPNDRRSLSLGPGERLEHREGAQQSTVLAANADEAFAWRAGRLIYRDRPLSQIAADLNRYGEDRVEAAGPAAGLRFSGVLTIDNQPAMAARLSELMPMISVARKDGVITLRAVDNAH